MIFPYFVTQQASLPQLARQASAAPTGIHNEMVAEAPEAEAVTVKTNPLLSSSFERAGENHRIQQQEWRIASANPNRFNTPQRSAVGRPDTQIPTRPADIAAHEGIARLSLAVHLGRDSGDDVVAPADCPSSDNLRPVAA